MSPKRKAKGLPLGLSSMVAVIGTVDATEGVCGTVGATRNANRAKITAQNRFITISSGEGEIALFERLCCAGQNNLAGSVLEVTDARPLDHRGDSSTGAGARRAPGAGAAV